MQEVVRAATAEAARTCEVCAAPGELRSARPDGTGWLRTVCDSSADPDYPYPACDWSTPDDDPA